MKKKSIIACLLLLLLFASCEKASVITSPAYAIGTIDEYDIGSEDVSNTVGYTFTVNGEDYSNGYHSNDYGPKWNIPYDYYKVGTRFMVEYDAGCINSGQCNKGKESRMLFNYPVFDSSDYNRYVTQFAVTPPTP